MKQLEIDDRTFARAEQQARALHVSIAEYFRSLIERAKAPRPSTMNPIGLFADHPEIIDDMMVDVLRTRSLPLRSYDA